MNTREELLNGLNDAVSIIKQLANIQQQLTNVRNQYKTYPLNTKRGKRISWLFILVPAIVGGSIMGDIGLIVGIVLGFFVRKYYYTRKNETIDKENEVLQTKENAVLVDLQNIQAVYREKLSSWYPNNYCSVDAVEFFHNAVKNYRADSLKEAINLYETALHQKRVEDTQKQALQEQRLHNLANLAMQGAQLNEMSRHNATAEFELQRANRTLNDIQTRL